jgi:DNA polymerase-3 subunit beta
MDIVSEADAKLIVPKKALTLLKSDVGTYKLAGENAIDFPRIPPLKAQDEITIPANVLSRAINSTLFATSNDDLRPAMTGVLFEFTENSTTFVSTDGHRLVRYRRMDIVSEADAKLIVPKKALTLLKSALPSDSTDVLMSYTVQNAYFKFDNHSLICRLIDERYPDYEAAIPASNPFVMVIPRTDFMASLKRVSLYANKTTHQIRLKISEKEVVIMGEDLDFSNEGADHLDCEYDGDALEIGFNARFLTEMLSNLESNLVELHLAAPNKQGLLLPRNKDASEDVLMLVMPVMLNTYVS